MRHARRGRSLPEVLIAAMILAGVVTATGALLSAGQRTQRAAGEFSGLQSDLRTAVRTVSLLLRPGSRVKSVGTQGPLAGQMTNGGQLVVGVPDPQGAGGETEVRFYVQNSAFYLQRADENGPGSRLLANVQAISFRYLQVVDSVETPTDGSPQRASVVDLTLTASTGSVTRTTTTLRSRMALRNARRDL